MATIDQSWNGSNKPLFVQGDDGNGNLVSLGVRSVNALPFTNTFTAVSTSSVTILAAGTYKTVIFANVGATIAYINLSGGAAVAAQCIPLLPSGTGTMVLDNTTPSTAVTAISSGVGTTIVVAYA